MDSVENVVDDDDYDDYDDDDDDDVVDDDDEEEEEDGEDTDIDAGADYSQEYDNNFNNFEVKGSPGSRHSHRSRRSSSRGRRSSREEVVSSPSNFFASPVHREMYTPAHQGVDSPGMYTTPHKRLSAAFTPQKGSRRVRCSWRTLGSFSKLMFCFSLLGMLSSKLLPSAVGCVLPLGRCLALEGPYRVLGLSKAEILKDCSILGRRYHDKALKYHSDKVKRRADDDASMVEINIAYQSLRKMFGRCKKRRRPSDVDDSTRREVDEEVRRATERAGMQNMEEVKRWSTVGAVIGACMAYAVNLSY